MFHFGRFKSTVTTDDVNREKNPTIRKYSKNPKNCTHGGARTHDHTVKSRALYRLSYAGVRKVLRRQMEKNALTNTQETNCG